MSIVHDFLPGPGLLLERIVGRVRAPEVRRATELQIAERWSADIRCFLSDTREATIDLNSEETRVYSEWLRSLDHPIARVPLAILCDSARETALSMLLEQDQSSAREVGVFSTLEAAAKWLSVELDQVESGLAGIGAKDGSTR